MAKTTFPQNTSTLESIKPADGGSRVAQDMRNALSALFQGDLSPIRARAQSTPNMTLKVNASLVENFYNQFFRNLLPVSFAGGNSPAVAAPSSNPRIDILTLTAAGTLTWITGQESATPSTPWASVPGDSIPICLLYCKTTMDRILNYEDKDSDSTEGYVYQDVRPFFAMGASKFVHLTDAPASYTGQANKQVRVKLDQTGLEFFNGVTGAEIDVLRDNLAVLAFRQAVQGALSVQKFEDGVMDDFQDTTGVDTVNSINASHDSANKLYSPSKLGGGIDQNVKLLVQNNLLGAQSKAVYFDGTGDYLSVADHADWDFGTGDFTIEGWFRFINGALDQCLLGTQDTSNLTGGGFGLRYDGINLVFAIQNIIRISSAFTFEGSKWYHIAGVRSGSTAYLFVNGRQLATASDSANVNSANEFRVGRNGPGGTDKYINGWAKGIRLSNTARYTASFEPKTDGLFSADSNTKLLILAEESNGAVTFTDSETTPKTVTTNGNCVLVYTADYRESHFKDTETTPKEMTDKAGARIISQKFNKSAGFFAGSGSVSGTEPNIVVPNHADWNFGTGDFTVELWVMHKGIGANVAMLGRNRNVGAGDWEFNMTGTGANLTFGYNGATKQTVSFPFKTNVWYHLAWVRSGSTLYTFINGIDTGTHGSDSGNISGSSEDIFIGSDKLANWGVNGWMKELRISNNARYTANFTPSAAQFSSDANTKLLLHFDTPATFPLSPCINFDGSGDNLSIADHADWDIASSGEYTAEFWYRTPNSVDTDAYFIGQQDHSALSGGGWGILMNAANIQVDIQNATVISAALTLQANRWYHIAFVRSATTAYLYIDGKLLASASNSVSTSSSNPLKIGVQPGTGGKDLTGWMKMVRVSNVARYAAAFTPTQNGFTNDANTKLLIKAEENNGATTFVDSETTPKTITTNGNTVISYEEDYRATIFKDDGNTGHKPYGALSSKVDFMAPFGSGACYLDGTGDYVSIVDHADWDFGTGNWTLEGWIRWDGSPASTTLLNIQDNTNGINLAVYDTGGVAGFHIYVNGTEYYSSHAYTPIAGVWYHFAGCRSGNNLYFWINGTKNGNTEDVTGKNISSSSPARIGSNSSGSALLKGWCDNLRISNIARYTAVFNPPTSEYDLGTTQDMTLISQTQTAQAAPSAARVILLQEDVDAVTLNTDLKAWASRDGTNYDQITLVNEGNYDANKKILAGNIDPFVAASGVSMKYKLTTHNAKDLKVHAAGLTWK